MIRALIASLALLAGASAVHAQSVSPPAGTTDTQGPQVSSPDGRITVIVSLDADKHARYAVARDGKPVIAPSKLGFNFTDADPWHRNIAIEGVERASGDERWEQPWGERRFVTNRYNEMKVRLRETSALGRVMVARFRVFDNGVGFRMEVPEQPNFRTLNIAEELTEFDVAEPGTAWWIPGGAWNRYEYIYNRTPIDGMATAHTPVTMRLESGLHLSFHEAALVDYSAMWFKRIDGRLFRAHLAPGAKGPKVTRAAPFATPWRTIRIAEDAARLYDNDLELNLNEPNKLGDVSWVKPYKYVGVWWEMHLDKSTWGTGRRHGATTENTRRYIDFAAKHGFRGVLVEGWNKGWDGPWFGGNSSFSFTQPTPDFDLEGLAAYARRKGVRLIGHHETGGNIADYETQLEDAMALYGRLGVDSVKTGYVADFGGIQAPGPGGRNIFEYHDGQRMAQHHLKVVEAAARHKVAVNAHEPIKDTGLRRTYPNWVAREGARGMEYNGWGTPINPVDHEATLIFTRMLSGPMDFTPGVLSLAGKDGRTLNSTLAKQLALYLTIYSPIQMAADLPENLERYPRELAFIAGVPVDWAETDMLDGAVGDYAVIARKDRNSEDWYVGGVTDEEAREVTIPLGFLSPGKSYTATVYRDGDDADYRTARRHSIVIDTRRVSAKDTLSVRMAPGGGFAVKLAPRR